MTGNQLPQGPIEPGSDLRDMLRRYLVHRSMGLMKEAAQARKQALDSLNIDGYRARIREAVRGRGNCHFVGGVRSYPLGETSSRYFVADALRCLDYLGTRSDV